MKCSGPRKSRQQYGGNDGYRPEVVKLEGRRDTARHDWPELSHHLRRRDPGGCCYGRGQQTFADRAPYRRHRRCLKGDPCRHFGCANIAAPGLGRVFHEARRSNRHSHGRGACRRWPIAIRFGWQAGPKRRARRSSTMGPAAWSPLALSMRMGIITLGLSLLPGLVKPAVLRQEGMTWR